MKTETMKKKKNHYISAEQIVREITTYVLHAAVTFYRCGDRKNK